MSRIAVLVEVSPESGQIAKTCIEYCETALDLGHSLDIFMYSEGVFNISTEQDYLNKAEVLRQWEKISKNPLSQILVCFSGAIRRGVVDQKLRRVEGVEDPDEWFQTGGLGQWTENMFLADVVIQFK